MLGKCLHLACDVLGDIPAIRANVSTSHRVRQLREEPYTQKEAEAAIGLGVNNEDPHEADKTAENEAEMAT
jgi:bud site selection protein 20